MIGGCVKSDTCREKLKGKREAYCWSDSRQELRSCIRSRISQAANGVHSAVVLYGLTFITFIISAHKYYKLQDDNLPSFMGCAQHHEMWGDNWFTLMKKSSSSCLTCPWSCSSLIVIWNENSSLCSSKIPIEHRNIQIQQWQSAVRWCWFVFQAQNLAITI